MYAKSVTCQKQYLNSNGGRCSFFEHWCGFLLMKTGNCKVVTEFGVAWYFQIGFVVPCKMMSLFRSSRHVADLSETEMWKR